MTDEQAEVLADAINRLADELSSSLSALAESTQNLAAMVDLHGLKQK